MALKILVIDDDMLDRELVKRSVLQMEPSAAITMAETGEKGLDLLKKDTYDCVFLDYILPDINGVEFLRKIYNTDTDLPPFPIIMLTGQGNVGIMADALQWGAQDYIIKSNVSKESLKVLINKARETFEIKKSRHMAEEQLSHAQKMEAVGQLTSGVAHDFNNLLTVILGNTRILQRRLQSEGEQSTPEELLKKVQAISTAAQRGAELVRRLMVFTRQRAPEAKVVDLNICVEEATELFTRALGSAIEVKTIFGENLWPASIDVGQFENALINLAVNARDAMSKSGKLTIETSNVTLDAEYSAKNPDAKAGPHVMVSISDTGCGMPASVAQRIFEPFFTTKAVGEGTGLGLSMVYGFVRQSEGHIHVYSEEGRGTVFRIYLPKYVADGNEIAQDNQTPIPEGTETILIVDDDPIVSTVAAHMLESLGYKLLVADGPRTALEILKQENHKIKLMLTDLVMPGGMNGVDLAKKAQGFYPGLRVLFASGYTKQTVADYKMDVGANLIGKPYSKRELATRVRQLLDAPDGETNESKAANTGH